MKVHLDERAGSKVAVIDSANVLINNVQDALDLMATVQYMYGCNKLIMKESAMNPDFFALKSGLAGEILQKFSNYQVKIAIIGDFEKFSSKSLRDFIYESNQGNQVFFLADNKRPWINCIRQTRLSAIADLQRRNYLHRTMPQRYFAAQERMIKFMSENRKKLRIKILKNGPYLVSGNIPLSEKSIVPKGKINEYHQEQKFSSSEEYALCRCGHSQNPPYCDGSHQNVDFDGTETASREDYDVRAQQLEGPDLLLKDDNRCAFARFCHREEGNVWQLTRRSADPQLRKEAITGASECPTGRLVACDRDGNPLEPEFDPAMEILQDPANSVSGPIFVKGGIPLESAEGFSYEIRNRFALCRCGQSHNKPFCDASHVASSYRDRK